MTLIEEKERGESGRGSVGVTERGGRGGELHCGMEDSEGRGRGKEWS